MTMTSQETQEATYPLRAAARLTGLSAELLRAWERRYGVVEPLRTSGGSRRYRAADLERLRLLKAAVDAGHRISSVAHLESDELRQFAEEAVPHDWAHLDEILEVVTRLASSELRQRLALQMSTLGPSRFAREIAAPLVAEVGARWSRGELDIAHEHLLSSHLRSLLGAAMLPTAASVMGPNIVFATPPNELHELGLLMAALTALGAGAEPIYLGIQLPVDDLVAVAEQTAADAVALSLVNIDADQAREYVRTAREELPGGTQLLIGGPAANAIEESAGVEHLSSLERFEQHVALLGLQTAAPPQ